MEKSLESLKGGVVAPLSQASWAVIMCTCPLTPDINLTATVDTHKPSVMLKWDPPENAGEVQTYDIRYRPSKSWWITPYHRTTVKTPATQVLLTKEDGLKLFLTYDFEVTARNTDFVGQWIRVSKYMGMYLYMLATSIFHLLLPFTLSCVGHYVH